MLAEQQWAQITLLMRGKDDDGNDIDQYTVFERWLADKLSYIDWKLCFILMPKDFDFIHDYSVIKDDSEYTTLEREYKESKKQTSWKPWRTAYV